MGAGLIAPDLWLAAWDREARRRLAAGDAAVVNDSIRFENEAAAIRALGGRVIRLGGRRDPRVEVAHASEHGVLADLTIDNAGDLSATVERVVRAARGSGFSGQPTGESVKPGNHATFHATFFSPQPV